MTNEARLLATIPDIDGKALIARRDDTYLLKNIYSSNESKWNAMSRKEMVNLLAVQFNLSDGKINSILNQ
jgi:hypothetical protein